MCFRLLSDPEGLDRYLLETGFEQVFHTQPTPVLHSTATRFVFDSSVTPPPDSGMAIKQDGCGSGACLIYKYLCAKGGQGVGAPASLANIGCSGPDSLGTCMLRCGIEQGVLGLVMFSCNAQY